MAKDITKKVEFRVKQPDGSYTILHPTTSADIVDYKAGNSQVVTSDTDTAIDKILEDVDAIKSKLENLDTFDIKLDNANLQIDSISSKVDLVESKLDEKQDNLISGETIKTVNGQSVLGEGDVFIDTSLSTDDRILLDSINNKADNADLIAESNRAQSKEDALQQSIISEADDRISKDLQLEQTINNLKTINGKSLLGPGNIEIVAEGGEATELSWGNLTGNLEDQTDLKNALNSVDANINTLADSLDNQGIEFDEKIEGLDTRIINLNNTVSNKADKTEIPTKTSDLENDSNFITNVVDNLVNYYNKNNTYNKDELNEMFSVVEQMQTHFVEELPNIEDASAGIYFVILSGDYYIVIDDNWEKIGSLNIDLNEYAKVVDVTTDINAAKTELNATINTTKSAIEAQIPTTENINTLIQAGITELAINEYVDSAIAEALTDYATSDSIDALTAEGGAVTEAIEAAKTEFQIAIDEKVDTESFNAAISNLESSIENLDTDNQTIKVDEVEFGANTQVELVADVGLKVEADSITNKITFGLDDEVELILDGGGAPIPVELD